MPSPPNASSAVERRQNRAYLREFAPAMLGYLLTLPLALWLGDTGGEVDARLLWWLLPLAPVGLVIRAVVRALHRSDEYQRDIQLVGMSIGFAASMFAAMTFGLLGIQVDLPTGVEIWGVFSVGMLGWAIAVAIRSMR